jgi:hypothetical protein
MSKQNLNEQINRIKQLLNINESSVIEEAGNPIMDVIRKLVPGLEAKITTALEKELGKVLTASTDKEIEIALKSATMAAVRKELAAAIYAAEKNMIDDVFKKYNMSIPADASKAYVELQNNGLNRGILRDVAGEWRAGSKAGSSSVTPAPNPKPKPNDPVNTFKLPDIDIDIPDFWRMDDKATRSALKNMFPKAPSSDLEKIVSNLRNMKLTNQADFDSALKSAVGGFGPKYKDILTKPSTWSKVSSKYAALPKWGKIIFWIATVPVGYKLLKGLGVPVDKTLGALIDGWREIAGDARDSVKKDDNTAATTTTPTNTVDDSEKGLRNYFATQVDGHDRASADALQIKSLGSSRYEITKDGTKTIVIYSDGKFKRE